MKSVLVGSSARQMAYRSLGATGSPAGNPTGERVCVSHICYFEAHLFAHRKYPGALKLAWNVESWSRGRTGRGMLQGPRRGAVKNGIPRFFLRAVFFAHSTSI